MDIKAINELERRRLQKQMFALEDEKEAVEARYKYLLQQARVGLFTLNSIDCRLKDANSEMVQLFLCDDLNDLKLHLMPHPEDQFYFIDPRHFANLEPGEAVSFSLHSFRKNGDSFWARIILQALEGLDVLEGIITDISDQVKADSELRKAIVLAEQAQQEAEEANKAKSRFLANISHEIRTPLNGIIGFTEIIMASLDSPEGQMYGDKILNESENLMTLINQLLDISKIEANQLELNNSSFPLRPLMSESMSFIRLRARNKGLKLTVDYDSRIPDFIWSDSYRLRQILLNLMSNAVKFTSKGGIELKSVLEEEKGNDLLIRFEVHDTGIGIHEDMHRSIFESFVQADTSISRNYGGTGLGITISRDLVNIMGGRIWCDSTEGKGSIFYFTIRCRKSEAVVHEERLRISREGAVESLEGMTVLVVEDYPTNREIVQHHLQSAGCEADLARNGLVSLSKIQEKKYDLVLMDVHMPKMDGMEATRRIRRMDGYGEIPIIGMTANVLSSNQEECRIAGMNDVLTKPLRKKELLEAMTFWYSRTESAVPDEESDEPESNSHESETDNTIPFDYKGFLNEMDGDREAVNEIILGFMDNLELQTEIIEKAIEERDLILIHREAHSIKGGALNLGANDLASWSLALEKAAMEKYSDIIPHLFVKLKQCISDFLSCRDRFSSIV
ncbi:MULTISPECIES: response regulator [unclassified Oceanispirochaeta]|uniref:response regulator n=1 Tax=unclassified Oceanispirochaeta TaxID=2635722 RepID=UPI000E099568|nr:MULTISPECIES: response regulator [unclassified Oceanispirochaeta]MBF9017037.1 response regulator [Oceanispirochaeta sp. M2]NPD73486.1 response regulator [Oceanispirochaeta sp. M1]RDG30777.1 response regulator [Oceanispirochaeta sp. M1]